MILTFSTGKKAKRDAGSIIVGDGKSRHPARSFQLRDGSIKLKESFEKSQELKDRSENFLNQ
jgi:hypothetical protein